jgi:hypothetical protein
MQTLQWDKLDVRCLGEIVVVSVQTVDKELFNDVVVVVVNLLLVRTIKG